ncbi:tetratricopeptide repeat protein [Acanthopleuribacter pedis]|uniref:Tetratricopeptide repeat protein n=1 Tax=Acanthopleuribacter pedis TaxID=442870 RepID=A0A8J7QE24_9BACT|nr:tetratricopeptide repeat protein [Acanthopleuribacter pedis]MBO1317930.1 tetratricopeptide repeat protein [Acanthopleuribacter pedis]
MDMCHFQLHHPDSVPRHVLLEELVGREHYLEQILLPLKEQRPVHERPPILLLGPAGLGKTSLLWALKYGVEADPQLQADWLPVLFPEEPNAIGDHADFWLTAIRCLTESAGLVNDHADRLLEEGGKQLAKKARALFFKLSQDVLGKKVLLLVDSFDQIARAFMNEQDAWQFREHLVQHAELYVVAAAPAYFKAVTDMDGVFYDVFRFVHLDPFRRDLAQQAFRKWAGFYKSEAVQALIKEEPQRFHTLRVLCGGNPRLLRQVFRIWHRGESRDVLGDLERLYDDLGADYKNRIRRLKPLVRRTFDAIARHWRPVGVGPLTRQLRKPSNYVSAQIKRLTEEGYIEEVGGSEKRKTYQLVERFYNLFYLARYDRQNYTKVTDLVDFMDLFYRPSLLIGAQAPAPANDWKPEQPRAMRFAYYNAFGGCLGSPKRRGLVARPFRDDESSRRFQMLEADLTQNLPDHVREDRPVEAAETAAWFSRWVGPLIERVYGEHPEASAWSDAVLVLRQLQALPLAEATCRRALAAFPEDARLWNWLGALCEERGLPEEALEAYQSACSHDDHYALAHANLARLYAACFGRFDRAEEHAEKALEKGDREPIYWFLMGNLYAFHLGRYEEAEEAYGQAIDLRENFFTAWNNLGIALAEMGQIENAEHAFRRTLRWRNQSALPWNNLGVLCGERMDRAAYAEHAFHRAVDADKTLALAHANLGLLYRGPLQRPQQAEDSLMQAIEHAGESGLYYLDLGSLLIGGGRRARAMEYFIMALKLSPEEPLCREAFLKMTGDNPYPWSEVLPSLLDYLPTLIRGSDLQTMRHFILQGFFCLARAGRDDTVTELLEHEAVHTCFQPLREALSLKQGKISIDQLAPERLALIDEVRDMI